MAYQEVTMLEVKEILRLWLGGCGKKRIARLLRADVETVRGYIIAPTYPSSTVRPLASSASA